MSALDKIRQAFPELANASDSEVLGEAARRTGVSVSQLSDTLGIAPRGTLSEMGRQFGAGLTVDAPRMAGQALKYFSDAGGERVGEGAFPRLGRPTGLERQYGVQISEAAPAYRAGQALVESADVRGRGSEADLRGRGVLGEALVTGARGVGGIVPTLGLMAVPGGQVLAPALQAGLFGGSSAQDTYEKLIEQGIAPDQAEAAARRVFALQGLGEGVATAGLGALMRPAVAAVRGARTTEGVAKAATDTSVLRPFAKGMALNVPLQAGTEAAQDVGTSLIEQSYGATPEDLGNIARGSALAGAGMSLLLGPLALGGSVTRARRAQSLKDALYNPDTPVETRAKAMDLVMGEARRQGVAEQDVDTWFNQQLELEDARTAALQAAEQQEKIKQINLLGEKAQGLEGLQGGVFSSLDQQRAFEQGLAGVQIDTPFSSLEQQRAFTQGLETARDNNIARIGQQYQDLMGDRASTLMQVQDIGQQAQSILAPQQRGLAAATQAGEQWQEIRAGKTRTMMDIDDMGQEWQKLAKELPQPVTGELSRAQKAALRGPEGKRFKPTSSPFVPTGQGPASTTLLEPAQQTLSATAPAPTPAPSSLLSERPVEPVTPPGAADAVAAVLPAAQSAAGVSSTPGAPSGTQAPQAKQAKAQGQKAPVTAGSVVKVNDTEVTLDEKQAAAWNAAQESYDGKVRRAKALTNYQERDSALRAAGMQLSAERRKITGALTTKEQQAAATVTEEEVDEASTARAQKAIDELGLRPLAGGGQTNLQASVTGGKIDVAGKASFGSRVLAAATKAFIKGPSKETTSPSGKLARAARAFGDAYRKYLNAAGNLTPSESKAVLKPTKAFPVRGDAAQAEARAGANVAKVRELWQAAQAALSELGSAAGNNAKNVEVMIRLIKDDINTRKAELDKELEIAMDPTSDVDVEPIRAEIQELERLDLGLSQGWASAKRGIFRADKATDMLDVRGGEIRTSREEQRQGFTQPLVRAATSGAAVGPRAPQQTGLQGVLNYIRSKGTPFERMIAKSVSEVFKNTKNPPTLVFAEGTPGFDPTTNTVTMSPTASPEVALHEALHAALQWYVHSNPKNPLVKNLLKAVDKVVKFDTKQLSPKAAAVQQVLADLKRDKRDLDAVLELVSYGNTLVEFRKALEAMPTKGTPTSFVQGAKDVWNMILATVRNMLNVPQSVASDVILDSFKLLEEASRAEYKGAVPGPAMDAAVTSGDVQTLDSAAREVGYADASQFAKGPGAFKTPTQVVFELVGLGRVNGKDLKLTRSIKESGAEFAEWIRKNAPTVERTILNFNSRFSNGPLMNALIDVFKFDQNTGYLQMEKISQHLTAHPELAKPFLDFMDGNTKALDGVRNAEGMKAIATNLRGLMAKYIDSLPANSPERRTFERVPFSQYLLHPNSIGQVAGSKFGVKTLAGLLGTETRREASIDDFKHLLATRSDGSVDLDDPMYQLFEDKLGQVLPAGFISKAKYEAEGYNPAGMKVSTDRIWKFSQFKDGDYKFSSSMTAKQATDTLKTEELSAALLNTTAALAHTYASRNFLTGLKNLGRQDGKATAQTIAFDNVQEVNSVFPDRKISDKMVLKVSDESSKAQDIRLQTQRTGTWVQLPASDNYGDLAGKIVPGPVWNAMLDMHDRSPLINVRAFNSTMAFFKKAKTVYNPGTHVTNILSNVTLATMHGLTFRTMGRAAKMFVQFDTNPGAMSASDRALVQAFYDSGAVLGQFSSTEVKQTVYDKLSQAITPDSDSSYLTKLKTFANYEKNKARLARVDNLASDIYAAEDNVFRLAAFLNVAGNLQVREGTKTLTRAQMEEAGLAARKMFLDYDIDARAIRAMRQSFLPFISWSYAIMPVLGRMAIEKPWAMANVLMAYALMSAAMEGDDEEEMRKAAPDYLRDRAWGGLGPYMHLRVPFIGDAENPVYFNLGKYIPMFTLFQPPPGEAKLAGQEWIPGFATPSGPFISLISAMNGYDPFTGKPMHDPTDTQWDKLVRTGKAAYDTMAPAAVNSKFWDNIGQLANDVTGPTGVEKSALFLARNLGGLGLYQFNVDESRFYQDLEVKRVERDFSTAMNKAKRLEMSKGYPDYEALDAELDTLAKRLEKRIAEIRGEKPPEE